MATTVLAKERMVHTTSKIGGVKMKMFLFTPLERYCAAKRLFHSHVDGQKSLPVLAIVHPSASHQLDEAWQSCDASRDIRQPEPQAHMGSPPSD